MQTPQAIGAVLDHCAKETSDRPVAAFDQEPLGCLAPPGVGIGESSYQLGLRRPAQIWLRTSRAA